MEQRIAALSSPEEGSVHGKESWNQLSVVFKRDGQGTEHPEFNYIWKDKKQTGKSKMSEKTVVEVCLT